MDLELVKLFKRYGKHCFMWDMPNNKIIKIFYKYQFKDWEDIKTYRWGDLPQRDNPDMSVPLIDATKIQNMCSYYGLAPRVYKIVKVLCGAMKQYGQLQDDVGIEWALKQEDAQNIYNKVKELGEKFGFGTNKDDVSVQDVINGKLIDFNTFHLKKGCGSKIKEVINENIRYGKIYYQQVPELEMNNSPRKNDIRLQNMQLDKIDFKGKSVLDLGSAGGFFCRKSKDFGADKVIGIDCPDHGSINPILGAQLISNELCYWDIDFYNLDLSKNKPEYKTDIVFFLSLNFHIGIPEWLPEITNEVCIFEDNSKDRNAEQTLKKMFSRVEFIGKATDHGDKMLYHCYK